jgi:nucleotide-binding universal stress UspA family protein
MTRFKSILVALDFSDCSWDVAGNAVDLARSLGARALLVHVDELPRGVAGDTPVADGGETRDAATVLASSSAARLAEYEQLFTSAKVEATTKLLRGPIAETLLDAARTDEATMIVMGTHGRKGVARLLAGSVAEQVLRQADCPVLTVRTQHKPTCEVGSCGWCKTHVKEEQRRLEAEADG